MRPTTHRRLDPGGPRPEPPVSPALPPTLEAPLYDVIAALDAAVPFKPSQSWRDVTSGHKPAASHFWRRIAEAGFVGCAVPRIRRELHAGVDAFCDALQQAAHLRKAA
jgi:hypothetical protein